MLTPALTLRDAFARLRASQTVRTVFATLLVATALQFLWRFALATAGGDIAAQDFWAEAAHKFPGSAYNFAWYGGLHVPSYSIGSPYLMAWIGVRPTLMIAGTLASGLTALLVAGSGQVRRPWIASMAGALAWFGNSISGRATFALGMVFALAAVAVVTLWPRSRRGRRWQESLGRIALAVVCSVFATFGSPVAGLFLGLLAAGLWLTADTFAPGTGLPARVRWIAGHLFSRRRQVSYCLGVPPLAVILLSALLFPFSGEQPMHAGSVIMPVLTTLFVWVVTPPGWRAVRATAVVYIVAILGVWIVPSEIGSNVTRLGLIFSTVALIAALCSGQARNPLGLIRLTRWAPHSLFLVLTVIVCLIWQTVFTTVDAVNSRPAPAFAQDTDSIIAELNARHADLGRVEVVPSRSHIEASTLAPYFTLARGWNRQADVKRNPLFYSSAIPLTAGTYRYWLERWAVSYVVVPPGAIDPASQAEANLIARGLPYLRLVWSDDNWQLYAVLDPTPLVSSPGTLVTMDEAHMTIHASAAGKILVRTLYSPWLGLANAQGGLIAPPSLSPNGSTVLNQYGCVEPDPTVAPGQPRIKGLPYDPETDVWTMLWVPRAGTYTLIGPYSSTRGTPCPTPKETAPTSTASASASASASPSSSVSAPSASATASAGARPSS